MPTAVRPGPQPPASSGGKWEKALGGTPSVFFWALALLTRLGIAPNQENLKAVIGWANAEGGHFHNDAKYNPLNTTQPMPGAGNTGSQGNIKVYRSWGQGLDATVRTLRNGHYAGILQTLRKGKSQDVAHAIAASPWGTKDPLISKAIKDADIKGAWIHGINPDDPFNPQGAVEDAANAAKKAATAIPDFLGKLGVIFDGGWWLRVGQILLGILALGFGVYMIGRQYAPTTK